MRYIWLGISYLGLNSTVGVIWVSRDEKAPVTPVVAVSIVPNLVFMAGMYPPVHEVLSIPFMSAAPVIASRSLLVSEDT